jgi:hypothetical protein
LQEAVHSNPMVPDHLTQFQLPVNIEWLRISALIDWIQSAAPDLNWESLFVPSSQE